MNALISSTNAAQLRQWKRILFARARHGVASRAEVLRLGTIRSTLFCLASR